MIISQRPIKIIVFVLILIFYGILLAQKVSLPNASDLPRQIKIGEEVLHGNFDILYRNIFSHTEPDHTFFNHHWLSGIVFYLVNQVAGFSGLVILKIIVLLTTFSMIFRTALKKADFWLVALFSIPTILILIERADVRPEMFSYLFLSVYLYLLIDFEDHPQRNTIFWLVPLQLLWVNMHVFFSIGLMVVAGFLCEKIILHWRSWKNDLRIKKLLILLLLLFAVSFINPRGAGGVFYRYESNFPAIISENQSFLEISKSRPLWADVATAVFLPMLFLLAVSFVWGLRRKQKPLFYFLASLATTTLSFIILRSLALFGMILLLSITTNFSDLFKRWKSWLIKESPLLANKISNIMIVVFIIAMLVLIVYGPNRILVYPERGIGLAHDSDKSAMFFKDHGLRGPIFNDANSGSYLIYYLYPQEKVFSDNRFADAYSAPFFKDVLFRMISDERTWEKMQKQYNLNTIIFYHYLAGLTDRLFLVRRMSDPAWALVYGDSHNVIFVKNTPENQDLIKEFHITKENAVEKFRPLLDSSNIDDKIAAGDLFNLIGLSDLALSAYYDVAIRWPDRYRTWMIMGEMETSKDNPTDLVLATMFLLKSIEVGGGTAEAYAYLGLAYYKLTEMERAREAIYEALRLDPSRTDAQELSRRLDAFDAKKIEQ